ncbi:SDR family NAD(P)-dependent oxidoreductase [Roseomonas sp. CCTCC AB2023176]|uniref:SDR family NAD(P)-dependent oxidoreductase n=1 Tax=Roseomonas sp. CCTCC AB2023176 TaxID=3342640 RepID=UPI0035D6B3A4
MSGSAGGLAVVTGGTRGIGRAVAARLAMEGYTVVAAGRNLPAERLPPGVHFVPCDVTDQASVRLLFATLGGLRVAVLAAGIAGADPARGDEGHWRAILGSNLDGTWRCAEAASALMQGEGRIVTVASVLGLRAVPDQVAYVSAKHGVVGLTKALALKFAPRGITVNAVCPGWVATDMARQRWAELGSSEAEAAAGTPTRRITTAEEVASLVAWLCSAGARNVTGQAIAMDGGASL